MELSLFERLAADVVWDTDLNADRYSVNSKGIQIEKNLVQASPRERNVQASHGEEASCSTRGRSLLMSADRIPVLQDGCCRGDQGNKVKELCPEIANIVANPEEKEDLRLLRETRSVASSGTAFMGNDGARTGYPLGCYLGRGVLLQNP